MVRVRVKVRGLVGIVRVQVKVWVRVESWWNKISMIKCGTQNQAIKISSVHENALRIPQQKLLSASWQAGEQASFLTWLLFFLKSD